MTNTVAQYKSMAESSATDWHIIREQSREFRAQLADRVMTQLAAMEEDQRGFPINRLAHSLQTATRAYRDDRDEEYIVCALLHDIGDDLGAYNHSDIAAAVLKPFVSEKNRWMVEHHAIFQGYYYFHHIGLDRDMRDQFADHPYYQYTYEFCHLYDQCAFDPEYVNKPLDFFYPAVVDLFKHPQKSIYISHSKTN